MREEIIRMAREAGMVVVDDQFSLLPFLERFFYMAQAAEREACAKVCEEPGWNAANWCAKAIRARGAHQNT